MMPVSIEVYNVTGQRMAVLVHEAVRGAGTYTIPFDAGTLPAGQYIARFSSGTRQTFHKLSKL